MQIYNFIEALKDHPEFKEFVYPSTEGVFSGKIVGAHWAPGAIIHTFWELENGDKLDCCLFRDKHCKYICDIEKLNKNAVAKLKFVKSTVGKIWLREIII